MRISFFARALVDSITPSAIAVTVHLLGQGRTAAHVVTCIVAICGTYLALGATMMLLRHIVAAGKREPVLFARAIAIARAHADSDVRQRIASELGESRLLPWLPIRSAPDLG